MNWIPFPPVILVLAYGLDLLIGDPERLPHPVRWIGRAVLFFEKVIRRFARTPFQEKAGGALLTVLTAGFSYAATAAALYLSSRHSPVLFFVLSIFAVWACISIRSLQREARDVAGALKEGALPLARKRLSRIVGRDTHGLTQEGVIKAAVETVSENTSDGIVAPLFYLAIGGPPLMAAYKAINTLDSMVGYKNTEYINFGWFSARCDDIANFIPARLSGLLIVSSSFILGYNWSGSFKTLMRDGRKHPSPNSGVPEAAVAGALGLSLGGEMSYGGAPSKKPLIGEGVKSPEIGSIGSSIRIMHAASAMMVALTFAARILMIFLL